MEFKTALFASSVIMLLAVSACASTRMFGAVHYTVYSELDREAVAQEDIQVYQPGEKPDRTFDEIGLLTYLCGNCRRWLRIYPDPFLQAAARIGVDAILLQEPKKIQQVDERGGYALTEYAAIVVVFRDR